MFLSAKPATQRMGFTFSKWQRDGNGPSSMFFSETAFYSELLSVSPSLLLSSFLPRESLASVSGDLPYGAGNLPSWWI